MMGNKTDSEVMTDFGARIARLRISRNITVHEIAERAELNKNTVMNAESGKNPRLSTVVRLLRVLGRLDALDVFLAAPDISPLDVVKRGGAPRQRASRQRHG